MRALSLFPLLGLLAYTPYGHAKIQTIHAFAELSQALETITPEDWVLFDVTGVLMVPQDKILRPTHQVQRKRIQTTLNALEPAKADHLRSIIKLLARRERVHPGMPHLVRKIQKRAGSALALTASQSGKLGIIPHAAPLRVRDLERLGFRFETSAPTVNKTAAGPSLFRSGILFAHRKDKGASLLTFLDHIPHPPKRVVFVDDKRAHLQSVQKALAKKGISFLGLHYLEATHKEEPVNEAVARFQYDFLIKHNIWLSDDRASILLKMS